jgi:hypothetical protein
MMDADAKTPGPASPLPTVVAPGCDSAHPTRIGGEIYGYPDRRAVNALVAVDAKADGVQVDRHGRRRDDPRGDFCGGYSWCIRLNPDVGPEGATDPAAVREWGTGDDGCVSAKIDEVFIEVYPQVKDESGGFHTDFTRYGAASHYRQPITPGRDNRVLLRLPVRYELGGNTGYVNGYVTYRGGPVPDPERNLVIRAFTLGRGPECGVEGFAASAERLQQSRSGTATYYRTPPLAAGRCGAASQRYSIQVTCKLLPGPNRQVKHVDVAKGSRKRIDFAF